MAVGGAAWEGAVRVAPDIGTMIPAHTRRLSRGGRRSILAAEASRTRQEKEHAQQETEGNGEKQSERNITKKEKQDAKT